MNEEQVMLGIAPIAWTNDDLPELGSQNTFEQCISEMALAGYTGSEVGNKYPKDIMLLKKQLKIRNLQICNAWFSTYFTTKTVDEVVADFIKHRDFLYEMGAKVIGISEQGNSVQGKEISIYRNKPIYTTEQWQCVINGFNRLAELAQEKDMKLCVHHHMGTGVQTEEEIDYLMSNSNENVHLLYDSGHLYFSEKNQDSVERVLRKHIKRIAHVHLKDIRSAILSKVENEDWSFLKGVKEGVFTIPGDGCISFDKIFETLNEFNYAGWMVVEAEQDPAKANPFEYAVAARKFIREKTGL